MYTELSVFTLSVYVYVHKQFSIFVDNNINRSSSHFVVTRA